MKDMGKDLDRWITEEQIQEAADLMTKQPERNKKFMEKKLNKLKREMELFGPQGVVSKYREYAEEKEEDYLWWLDLPHVLVSMQMCCVFSSLLFFLVFVSSTCQMTSLDSLACFLFIFSKDFEDDFENVINSLRFYS